MGGILALDVASTTGWAHAERDALAAWPTGGALEGGTGPTEGVSYGAIDLVKTAQLGYGRDTLGRILHEWMCALDRLLADFDPEHVTFEAPILTRTTSLATGRRLYSLAGAVELACHRWRIDVTECNNAKVRKHFIDQGNGPRDRLKELTIARCQARGWAPLDDNAADALATLDYAAFCMRKEFQANPAA